MKATIFTVTLLLSYAFAQSAFDEYFGDEIFRKIALPDEYRTTSSASITTAKPRHVELFYRGLEYGLIHATIFQEGNVTNVEKVGGTLLTAPSVVSPSAGNLDVAYVTEGLKVVTKAYRNGRWGKEVPLGIKSMHAPAIAVNGDGDFIVTATKLNGKVVSRTRSKGKWAPVQNLKVTSTSSPAMTTIEGEVYIFLQKGSRRVVSNSDFSKPVTYIPLMSSGICISGSPENGFVVFGRGNNGHLVGALSLDDEPFSPLSFASPWMDGPPTCFRAFPSCVEIVINHAGNFYRAHRCS